MEAERRVQGRGQVRLSATLVTLPSTISPVRQATDALLAPFDLEAAIGVQVVRLVVDPQPRPAAGAVGDVQRGTEVSCLPGLQHGKIDAHPAAVAHEVHDFDRPGFQPADDRRLAGEAHRPERPTHVDLAGRRLQHQAAAGHQDLQAVEARVVGERPGHGDRRAAEAPDVAPSVIVQGDVDGDAAAILPRRADDSGQDRAA